MVDCQAGHEKTMTALLPALGGVNLIYGLGMLDLGMTFSYEQLLIDSEIVTMCNRVLHGIPVNDATLGVDVISEVGPGGVYLSEEHTVDFMASESSLADLFDRNNRANWELAGSTDVYDRAHARTLEILAAHKPAPLAADVLETLQQIIDDAEKELL